MNMSKKAKKSKKYGDSGALLEEQKESHKPKKEQRNSRSQNPRGVKHSIDTDKGLRKHQRSVNTRNQNSYVDGDSEGNSSRVEYGTDRLTKSKRR